MIERGSKWEEEEKKAEEEEEEEDNGNNHDDDDDNDDKNKRTDPEKNKEWRRKDYRKKNEGMDSYIKTWIRIKLKWWWWLWW